MAGSIRDAAISGRDDGVQVLVVLAWAYLLAGMVQTGGHLGSDNCVSARRGRGNDCRWDCRRGWGTNNLGFKPYLSLSLPAPRFPSVPHYPSQLHVKTRYPTRLRSWPKELRPVDPAHCRPRRQPLAVPWATSRLPALTLSLSLALSQNSLPCTSTCDSWPVSLPFERASP